MKNSSTASRYTIVIAALAAVMAMVAMTASARAAVPDRKGWVLWDQSAGTTVAYGTWPLNTSVTPLAPAGRYTILFPGQAATGGVVHVTAINSSPYWCQVESWGPSGPDLKAFVRCYQAGGALAATSFSAFFTSASGPGAGPYGYVDSQASGALVSQYNSVGATNTSTWMAVGQWKVKFTGIVTGGPLDGGLQATAVNSTLGARCKVAGWASTAAGQDVTVFCFDSAGAPLNTRFTLTYQHKVSLYGAHLPPQFHGYLLNQPPLGPGTTNSNSMLGFGINTITPVGVGLSYVQFPQVGVAQNTVQVTAYGTTSDFCGLSARWINSTTGPDTLVRNVNCFTNTGVPVNVGFLVTTSSIN